MSDLRRVDRWACIALAWQVSNEVKRNPGKYIANSALLDRLTDNLRGLPSDDDDFITVQDAIDAMPLNEEDADMDDGLGMYSTTFAIYDVNKPEEWLVSETWTYYSNLRREADE